MGETLAQLELALNNSSHIDSERASLVFKSDLGTYTEPARRILAYIPLIPQRRKNIQYLKPLREYELSIEPFPVSGEVIPLLRRTLSRGGAPAGNGGYMVCQADVLAPPTLKQNKKRRIPHAD